MDTTAWVRDLFATVPVHATLGIEVASAEQGRAEVRAVVRRELANVVGAMHSSGITALVDASGLAALLSWCVDPDDLAGVTPLGRSAGLRFHAPGRGTLLARTELSPDAAQDVREFFTDRSIAKLRVGTGTEVLDDSGELVATGQFDWRLRRRVD